MFHVEHFVLAEVYVQSPHRYEKKRVCQNGKKVVDDSALNWADLFREFLLRGWLARPRFGNNLPRCEMNINQRSTLMATSIPTP
jgi:hypothetical protein